MMSRLLVCWALAWAALAPVHAGQAVDLAEDPVVERRLLAISEELRCLVCQNESLAGSRADLAMDLRREVRSLIKAGKSDAEIMEFMVSRYGDFVRYRPPVKPVTWALWFGPALLLLGAGGALWHFIRRQRQSSAPEALSPQEQARARDLLNPNQDPSS